MLRAATALAQARGDVAGALVAMRAAVASMPEAPRLRLALGQALASAGQGDEAIDILAECTRRWPGSVDAWYLLGVAFCAAKRDDEALPALRHARDLAPGQPQVMLALGEALFQLGRHEEALECLEAVHRSGIADPMLALRRAQCHRTLGAPDDALPILIDASARFPAIAPLWMESGGVREDLGHAGEAQQAYARAHALAPAWADPLAALVLLTRDAAPAPIVAAAEGLLGESSLPPQQQAILHHALGRRADHLDDRAAAAAHWRQANRLRRAMDGALDRADHRARIETLIARTTPAPAALTGVASDDARPVFVVGMPRSGTTLVEQILAAHPDAHGCGELPVIPAFAAALPETWLTDDASALRDLAARWCAAAARRAPQDARRLVDKHPFNLESLALVARLFPLARVVWCRRDVRDVALSIYSESFMPSATYATDLDDIRFIAREQARLMTHWRSALPLPVMEIAYETLVADSEATIRRLVAFAGLAWNDACLRFHDGDRPVQTHSRWQVRRPIHAGSIGRWRRHADWFQGWSAD